MRNQQVGTVIYDILKTNIEKQRRIYSLKVQSLLKQLTPMRSSCVMARMKFDVRYARTP